MHLYNLTLQRAGGITHAVHGNFSGTKQQEIIISHGRVLELLRTDTDTEKVHTLLTVEIFGVIHSMVCIRLMDESKDCLVVSSDSGKIVILEYNAQKNVFESVQQETFGESSFQNIIPGQFLAFDPKGRAGMLSAFKEQKLLYILSRDAEARLAISSPLEVHKSSTFVYHVVGMDVGLENPVFACLEMDYKEAYTNSAAQGTQQALTFYEIDLESNNIQKYSEPLEKHGNFLIAVPGGNDGPGGVLICSEDCVMYKNFGDQPDILCPIPKRCNGLDHPERGVIFVCSTTHKIDSLFFFLAQTEQGDVFRIMLEIGKNMVTEMKLKYFDTLPVASSMCILETGFLFVASEFGNHFLYKIVHLGEDDGEQEFSSSLEESCMFTFAPRVLKNLVLVDELESLSPVMHCQIADLANESIPQLHIACGRGPRSSLRVLRRGLKVSERAISKLPGEPNAVWAIKRKFDEEFDAYIILSFASETLVLSIGETVEEVADSGILSTTTTLSCAQIGEDALVQVYPEGLRYIKTKKHFSEWQDKDKKTITKCAVNQCQIVIALAGGSLVYFEVDTMGQLTEYTDQKEVKSEVTCMALASVPSGEQRSRFLAVGCMDNTVCIISLDSSDCLSRLSFQPLPYKPESLTIVEMGNDQNTLYLNIGLQNGVLLRTTLDQATGDLSDTRTQCLGSKPVKLFKVHVQGNDAVLAISTNRSWLSYYYQNRFRLSPLAYETLECASGFSSEACPEGIVATSNDTLRILALEELDNVFNQVVTPLEYTPRKFVIHPEGNLIIIETDCKAYTEKTKIMKKQQMVKAADEGEQEFPAEMAEFSLDEKFSEVTFGAPKGTSGTWASLIRVLNPNKGETIFKVPLEQNDAAFSICLVKFDSEGDDQFLLVGLARHLQHSDHGIVQTYQMLDQGRKLSLVHETEVNELPTAIYAFQEKVLIGVGETLRVYDMEKEKLVVKCEKCLPNKIVTIDAVGNLIIVGTVQMSFFFVHYKPSKNELSIFANDLNRHWITCATPLDCDTIAGADRFGNIFVIRLSSTINNIVEEDPMRVWNRGLFKDTSQKTDPITSFHVGEMVVSLQKTTLIPDGPESLVYTTLSGAIGVLIPLMSHEDLNFFSHLEMYMRTGNPPLCARNHLLFRSYCFSIEVVIDGDLCEQFHSLESAKQQTIAEGLCLNPKEVSKQLEDIRSRYAY